MEPHVCGPGLRTEATHSADTSLTLRDRALLGAFRSLATIPAITMRTFIP